MGVARGSQPGGAGFTSPPGLGVALAGVVPAASGRAADCSSCPDPIGTDAGFPAIIPAR
jgi:hypothetical protein